jgi:nucleoside-diphosphate-sugar epimerase
MVYILGGNGFVGSAIVSYYHKNHIAYKVITRESYDDLKKIPCKIFINANGNSKKFLAKEQPLIEFDASVRSVRSSLSDFTFDQYVYLSSCDVYPDCSSPSSTLEDIELDITKQSPYGFHKHLAELCVMHVAKYWLIIRMGGFVGPGMKKNPIFDILHEQPLWLDPTSELQFMHTDYFAKILIDILDKNIGNQIINICGSGTVSLNDVIALTGKEASVKVGSPIVHYDVSIERLRNMITIPSSRNTVLEFIRLQCNK